MGLYPWIKIGYPKQSSNWIQLDAYEQTMIYERWLINVIISCSIIYSSPIGHIRSHPHFKS